MYFLSFILVTFRSKLNTTKSLTKQPNLVAFTNYSIKRNVSFKVIYHIKRAAVFGGFSMHVALIRLDNYGRVAGGCGDLHCLELRYSFQCMNGAGLRAWQSLRSAAVH